MPLGKTNCTVTHTQREDRGAGDVFWTCLLTGRIHSGGSRWQTLLDSSSGTGI